MRRGTSCDAAQLVRAIIATRDKWAQTAHDVAAETNPEQLPDAVRCLLSQRGARTVHARRDGYQRWHAEVQDRLADRMRSTEQHLRTDQNSDYGIDL